MVKEVSVRKHKRKKPTGGMTTVKKHTRNIHGTPQIMEERLPSQETTQTWLDDCRRKGYSDEECTKLFNYSGIHGRTVDEALDEYGYALGIRDKKKKTTGLSKEFYFEELQKNVGDQQANILEFQARKYRNFGEFVSNFDSRRYGHASRETLWLAWRAAGN